MKLYSLLSGKQTARGSRLSAISLLFVGEYLCLFIFSHENKGVGMLTFYHCIQSGNVCMQNLCIMHVRFV